MDIEAIDLRTESLFEERAELPAQRGAIALARQIDETGNEAAERIAAQEKRDTPAFLQAENAHGDVVEIVLRDLEELVARKGLEDMRQRLAVMAMRIEA